MMTNTVTTTLLLLGILTISSGFVLSPAQTLIWGPGLNLGFNVPVRYFFIQAVDEHGNNITESVGEKAFAVQCRTRSKEWARVWCQVLDMHDGSYVVRCKPQQSYKDLIIDVTWNSILVAKSPYMIDGPVYHEHCNCPEPSLDKWLTDMECPANIEQIDRDLAIFPAIDMDKVVKAVVSRFNERGSQSLCHYVIKNNEVYRTCYGQYVDFKMFSDRVFLSLARKVKLPDLSFFINLGDWPLEKRRAMENPLPLISWCGSDESLDIVLPTYDFTQATLEMMDRVSLDIFTAGANTGPKWENKTSKAFWRGRDSRKERLDLVKMSFQHPDLIDARLTNMFFFPHTEDLGEIKQFVSFHDFFKFKYQINLDGTVAAYRFPYLLAGDSLILKQDSGYYEHFYKQLSPGVHYVPIKSDLSDLLDKIKWAIEHDDEARTIAQNGQMFARENLMPRDVICYHILLFKEYAKRIVSDVRVLEGMEHVPQPNDHTSACECQRLSHVTGDDKKDEL